MINDHPEYGELLKKHFPISDYHLDIEIVKDPPKDYIQDFFEKLKAHKNYLELKDDFVFDKELNVFIQVHNRFPISEISDLSQEEVFFYPFMSKSEIKQIFNIKSSADYLLRVRAEQVESEIRLRRTFSKLKKKLSQNWNFTDYFESSQYAKYLKKLNPKFRQSCIDIPHGTIHTNEANGTCLKTPFGNIITLSYSLREFLYYMNLFHFGEQLGVKQQDIHYAFILAIRIMIGTESLDFEIDSRGKLPKSIKKHIDYLTDWQMKFVIGHEYAHHYLGHLKNESKLKSHNKVLGKGNNIKHYTYRQSCEFEADLHSIQETIYNDKNKSELLNGAFLFFISLQLYDKVEEYLFPKIRYSNTHPEPLDRLWTLRKAIKKDIGYSEKVLSSIEKNTKKFLENYLKEFLPYNVDKIEMVGSIYLPSYKKTMLIDRLDI
ncbi:hypothetical protein ACFO3O_11435 [Dokdonia ponticola]|uniref:Peptidase M1 membrane alanine aminopeptidase domain-containing protein n=1 Tax=Dokdonia ponticola TaxID=2041041 RepID=A0ABV9HX10_9FLAO